MWEIMAPTVRIQARSFQLSVLSRCTAYILPHTKIYAVYLAVSASCMCEILLPTVRIQARSFQLSVIPRYNTAYILPYTKTRWATNGLSRIRGHSAFHYLPLITLPTYSNFVLSWYQLYANLMLITLHMYSNCIPNVSTSYGCFAREAAILVQGVLWSCSSATRKA